MSNQDVNWTAVGVILSVIGGVYVLLKSYFSFVTRAELTQIIEKLEKAHTAGIEKVERERAENARQLEERTEVKFDELRKTMLMLHEDNRHARHDLRDSLNAPIVNLGVQMQQLREYLQSRD